MSQLKRIACRRFVLFVLPIFALSIFWSGSVSAALWDDFLKKTEEAVSDAVDEAFDGNKESEKPQEPVQESSTAQESKGGKQPTNEENRVYTHYASSAGRYAGYADACGDAVGAKVSAEFEGNIVQFSAEFRRFLQKMGYEPSYNGMQVVTPNCDRLSMHKRDYDLNLQKIGAAQVAEIDLLEPNCDAPEAGAESKCCQRHNRCAGLGFSVPSMSKEAKFKELKRSLINHAGMAGRYAAGTDACSDPAGAMVRGDFEARAALLSPEQETEVMRAFDARYNANSPQAGQTGNVCSYLPSWKRSYEESLKALMAVPAIADLQPAGPITPSTRKPAPPDKTASDDSNAAEDCPRSGLNLLACKQAVKNPSSHSPEFVERCKKCGF